MHDLEAALYDGVNGPNVYLFVDYEGSGWPAKPASINRRVVSVISIIFHFHLF